MNKSPFKIAVIYLFISSLWILSSDYLLSYSSQSGSIPASIMQSGKGALFVTVTAVLLYLIIKKQQRSLLSSEKQYKNLFHCNPNPLWIYDINTLKFVEVNDAAVHKYGYSRSEFKSMTIRNIRPAEDLENLQASIDKLPEGIHISGHWRHINKSGQTFTVLIESHKITFNDRQCVIVMAQDVTLKLQQEEQQRKAYETEKSLKEELERSIALIRQSAEENKKLANVVERINNIVIITDRDGKITWVNQAFADITGYSFDEAVGRDTNFLHGPKTDPETQRLIMECVQRNEFCRFEVLNYTKSGKEYWIELSISAICSEKNEVDHYIAIQNIITERKEREAKIDNQNAVLRQIAWTNSHALRKPVASIMSLVRLSRETERTEEIKEIHLLIEESSLELDAIIKDISHKVNRLENF